MKKIIASALTVLGVTAAVVLATSAFFSDTETSVGNTFKAGSIDLTIDNSSYYNGRPREDLSWELSDLTDQLFFDFADLKPGDLAEDTISIHLADNDGWVCANVTLAGSDEDTNIDPENEAGDYSTGPWAGELDEELNFIFWADDGDNVLETDETVLMTGSPADLPQNPGTPGLTFTIVDSSYHALKGTPNFLIADDGDPFDGESTGYIGKAWCFGNLTQDPVAPGAGDPTQDPGVNCDGSGVGNQSQTDNVVGNITFYAEQSRNNTRFLCSSWSPSASPTPTP